MSEDKNQTEQTGQSELDALKERADLMGIKYHPNIKAETLRDKVNAALKDEPAPEEEEPVAEAKPVKSKKMTENERRLKLQREMSALVRIRITCMNPNKKEWEGETFSVGNRIVGKFTKYVPYDVPWHVPRFILNMIKQRQCQIFKTVADGKGNKVKKPQLIKEYSVEELPNLTEQELKRLAQRQAMANGTAEID